MADTRDWVRELCAPIERMWVTKRAHDRAAHSLFIKELIAALPSLSDSEREGIKRAALWMYNTDPHMRLEVHDILDGLLNPRPTGQGDGET